MSTRRRGRWLFSAVVLAALLVSVLPPVSPARAQGPDTISQPVPPAAPLSVVNCPPGQFLAQYYGNNTLTGTAVLERCEDAPLAYDGTKKPKEVTTTQWSARFTGKFKFEAGQYTFIARVDDGLRLKLDGTTVLDWWTYSAARNIDPYASAAQTLTAGLHQVVVEFHEDGGAWKLFAGWLPVFTGVCPTGLLQADYYRGTAVSGTPLFSRCEDAPIHSLWGSAAGPYGVRPGNFAVHWTGTISGTATSPTLPPVQMRFIGEVSGHMLAKVDGETIFDTTQLAQQRFDRDYRGYQGTTHAVDVTYESNVATAATVHFAWNRAPAACGVPLKTTIGRDDEILLGAANDIDNATNSFWVKPGYSWTSARKGPYAGARADALALSADTMVLVEADSSNNLGYRLVDGLGSATASKPLTLTITGDPALVSLNPLKWVVFARPMTMTNVIYYKVSNQGTVSGLWQEIPGVDNAASNLSVVAPEMSHMLVFYKDSANSAWFTEWVDGAWRPAPVALSGTLNSDLEAVAASPNYIALLAVGTDSHAYVKSWNPTKKADWSDTSWASLGTWHCQYPEPLAAVATDINHVTAACRGGSNVGAWQWNPGTGWGAVTQAYASPADGPLTLVRPDKDKVWAIWAGTSNLSRLEWTKAGGWGTTLTVKSGLSSSSAPGRVLALVTQPGYVHHFVRISSSNYYDYIWNVQSTTADYGPYFVPGDPFLGADQNIYGTVGGHAMLKVGGKTIWVSTTHEEYAGGHWWLSTLDPKEFNGTIDWDYELVAGERGWKTGAQGLAAGDFDADGDDEAVHFLATGTTSATTAKLYWVNYTWTLHYSYWEPWRTIGGPVTVNAPSGSSFSGPISAALGDLDGDGKRDQLVLAAQLSTNTTWLWLYQWNAATSTFDLQTGWPKNLQNTGFQYNTDLQIAIGKLRGTPGSPNEQMALAIAGCNTATSCTTRSFAVSVQRIYKTSSGWLREQPVSLSQSLAVSANVADTGPLSTALGVGDLDGDKLEEIVYSVHNKLYALDGDAATGTYSESNFPGLVVLTNTSANTIPPVNSGFRSISVGEVNGDGKAEVVLSAGPQSGTHNIYVRVFTWLQPPAGTGSARGFQLANSVNLTNNGPRVALIGDVDDDSWVSELTGCQTVTDARVTAVVNGPPRYVKSDGTPKQNGGGAFGRGSTDSQGQTKGTKYSVGASVSAGYKQDFEVSTPFCDVHVGSAYFNVTQEFSSSFGKSTERETETTESDGFGFGGNDWSTRSLGMVVYNAVSYGCYTYDTYNPNTPADKIPTMLCTPAGQPADDFRSLEYWNSEATRREFGSSWFHAGHDSNDVTAYPSAFPEGTSFIWQKTTPVQVSGDIGGGFARSWTTQSSEGVKHVTTESWDENTKVAVGGDVLGVTFEATASFGVGGESSQSVGHTTFMDFNGSVDKFNIDSTSPDYCANCATYQIQPYVAQVTAHTQGGAEYPYMVADYIVPSNGMMSQQAGQPVSPDAPQAPVQAGALPQGPLPAAPVVTSPTHPDPNTWYSGKDVTFNWQQPAGDQATVIGYRWALTEKPDSEPASNVASAGTMSYTNVPDGVHYLHIAAVSDAGAGPTTHLAVRVDAGAPAVTISLNPPSPNMAGWFNTPVVATIIADDGLGSGATLIEYSTGGAWQPYTGPLTFSAETVLTLSARATDGAGHVSAVATVPINVDVTPPSTVDVDDFGLSYARIDQDESGNNVQLVLGGALNDNLSGRSQVELSTGDAAAAEAGWRAVDAVGVFPMPPGNVFPSTASTLNWIYTPTFEIRGVYNIYGHGLDMAGNIETGWGGSPIGTLFWPPDGNPNLSESRLTASPSLAKAGDTVRFTLGLRNSGVQEAAVKVTLSVPAGLTVLPASISSGGAYDAASRQITWQVHAVWQKQVQYLTYAATVDAGSSGQLTTQVALLGYWPGYESDPNKLFNYTLSNVITVAPSAPAGAPQIIEAAVAQGPVVGSPQVTLNTWTSPGAQHLFVKEWTLDPATGAWTQVAASGWLPIANGAGMTVAEPQGGRGKQVSYAWTLAPTEGVHYLGIWAGDANQQPSNLNEAGLLFANLLGTPTNLAAGQRTQYRLPLNQGELAILTLATTGGDADLSVWNPRAGFKPAYWSNAAGTPPALDSLAFYAPESGDYLVEVQAVTDASFTLALGGALHLAGPEQGAPEGVLPAAVHNTAKARPDHPFALSTPFSLAGADVPGAIVPPTPTQFKLYLPLVRSGASTSGPAAPVVPETYPARQSTR